MMGRATARGSFSGPGRRRRPRGETDLLSDLACAGPTRWDSPQASTSSDVLEGQLEVAGDGARADLMSGAEDPKGSCPEVRAHAPALPQPAARCGASTESPGSLRSRYSKLLGERQVMPTARRHVAMLDGIHRCTRLRTFALMRSRAAGSSTERERFPIDGRKLPSRLGYNRATLAVALARMED